MIILLILLSFNLVLARSSEASDAAAPDPWQYPPGDVRNCPGMQSPRNTSQPPFLLDVLPGIGFDNLRNLDMGQVHYYNYSKCQVSKDGRYLIPDDIFLLPIQESHVDAFAEYFDHWDNHTSMTSKSINVGSKFFSIISGKFADSYMKMKTHQVNDKSKTTRVQIRHRLYAVKMQPEAQLHPAFKARLFDIAANIQNNNTYVAEYLAELLVRDYGTHFVTTMDAGAILAQVDQVSTSYVQDNQFASKKITLSASASLFEKVSMSASFDTTYTTEDKNEFINSRSHSEVFTFGGPRFRPNFTITEWVEGVPEALVAIDRAGNPLHFVINPTTVGELPYMTIRRISNMVYKVINRYYKVNSRQGCTDPNSPNFNFQANIDDGSCEAETTNFTFGGIYQTCQGDPDLNTEDLCSGGPQPAAQLNPLTGNFSCPEGYTPVQLHSGTVTHDTQISVQTTVCQHCGLFGWSRCCHQHNVPTLFLSAAEYQAYWCAATGKVEHNTGYLFGGFYTSTTSNPITGSMQCPRYFIPLHFSEDIQVCVSSDYELGYSNSIPFAGFESCQAGNPLAASSSVQQTPSEWPHDCPRGYAQHLADIAEGCEINICVKAGVFSPYSLLPATLPPFRRHPGYKKNVTEGLVLFGIYGEVWIKEKDGQWKVSNNDSLKEVAISNSFETSVTSVTTRNEHDNEKFSKEAVAVISIVTTVALGATIALTVFTGHSVRKCYLKRRRIPNRHLNEEGHAHE